VALAGLLLLATGPLGTGAAELCEPCVIVLRAALSTPHDSGPETVAGVLALAAPTGGFLLGSGVIGLARSLKPRRHGGTTAV
jgi:hypothetical protein